MRCAVLNARPIARIAAFAAVALLLTALEGRAQPPSHRELTGHIGGVTAMTFSDNGYRFATGAGNGIVRVWDVKTGEMLGKLEEFKGISITGLSFSPDGKVLAACGKGKAGFWLENLPKPAKTEPTPGKKEKPAFQTEDQPGQTKVDGKHYKWTPVPSTDVSARYEDVAISGDDKFIYYARRHYGLSYPGRVLRYDFKRDVTEEIPGPKYLDPRAVACIDDPESGLAVAYASLEKGEAALLMYGLGEPRTITRGVPPISNTVTPRLAFASDDRWVIAWSGSLAAWPLPGSHLIGGEPAQLPNVHAAAVGKGGVLATVPPPDELRKTEISFWKLRAQSKPMAFLGAHWIQQIVDAKKIAAETTRLRDVSCLAFSPNGRILAIGGMTDGVVILMDMPER